ncbi:hypothetical protein MAM1_0202d07909 [Mucor ambiguus]|uniref:Uncharacterized protein n=1 Tax=Mucor ambiguus TaxID=91626 RepID=A0A0C9N1E6_9FUNG|nr:hypothetical protein MAM1_0202d07909 [Mucor ambiguus]
MRLVEFCKEDELGRFRTESVQSWKGKNVEDSTSYKFVRVYPLNQYDIRSTTGDSEAIDKLALSNPLVDYTAPQYITLLLNDLGVLTPSGVMN